MSIFSRTPCCWNRLIVSALGIAIVGQLARHVIAEVDSQKVTVAISALQGIERKGIGHESAIEAYRVLSKGSVQTLPLLMQAIDDDRPLVANWLRGAVEEIAARGERERTLTPKLLEPLVFNERLSPRTRRLAFEWLSRIDPSATARIIPQMLQDSSVEMRRDAVAAVLAEAAKLAEGTDKALTIKAFRRALDAARDKDQVEQALTKLEGLGESVDLPKHFGFLTDWKLIGPFDNTNKGGFRVAYPPEEVRDFQAAYDGKVDKVRWMEHHTSDKYGMVNLNDAIGKNMGAAAYAATTFLAEESREVELRLGCINACKVWWNGKPVMSHEVYHAGTDLDQYVARVETQPGANEVLVKICQNEQTESWAQDWQFQLRVCDRVGTAILPQGK